VYFTNQDGFIPIVEPETIEEDADAIIEPVNEADIPELFALFLTTPVLLVILNMLV
jgi:hypothetical protein